MRWPVISTISLTCTRRRLDDRRVAGVHPCFAELIPTPPHVTRAVSRRGHRHPKTEGWGGDTPTYTQRIALSQHCTRGRKNDRGGIRGAHADDVEDFWAGVSWIYNEGRPMCARPDRRARARAARHEPT